jgi:hypothetical protein
LLAYYPLSELPTVTSTPDLYNGNDAAVNTGVSKYGNSPEPRELVYPDNTTISLDGLLDGTTFEAYVNTETEHSVARDI